MFLVMIEWTSEMSSVSFAIFRWVRVSIYSFLVFCMNVSAQRCRKSCCKSVSYKRIPLTCQVTMQHI